MKRRRQKKNIDNVVNAMVYYSININHKLTSAKTSSSKKRETSIA